MPRLAHEPGKGGLWYIVEDRKEGFKKEGLKTTSRGGARQPSNPNSPAPRKSPKKKTPPRELDHGGAAAGSPLVAHSLVLNGTETPSKAPRSSDFEALQSLPQLAADSTPVPQRQPYLHQTATAAGSPTNLSPQVYLADSVQGFNYYTPAPQRTEPRFTMPSTAKLPSQWLPQSSPNMWHFDMNAKPFPFDSSPVKGSGSALNTGLRSSSPAPALADGSPTGVRGTLLENRLNGTSGKESGPKTTSPPKDDDEDVQIDLMA